jgi:hypothetical protein
MRASPLTRHGRRRHPSSSGSLRPIPSPASFTGPKGDLKGYCEPMVALDPGKMVQFERVGFVRIEKATAMLIEAYWGHRWGDPAGIPSFPCPAMA